MSQKTQKSSLFTYIDCLYTKEPLPEGADVSSSLWMINRFLSMETILLDVIGQTSKYTGVLGERYYKLLDSIIPKTKAPRNKYLKPSHEFEANLIERYAKVWNCNWKEVVDSFKVLLKTYSQKDLYDFVGLEYPSKP